MTEANEKSSEQKKKKQKVKLQLKSPSQQRSRQTVATILEACERIISKEGFFGVSTDKVAKEAGVSIGSLYQFFGNKESVVCALIQDLFDKDRQAVKDILNSLTARPLEDRVRGLIKCGFDIYSTRKELRSRLQNVYQYLVDTNYFRNLQDAYEEQIALLISPVNGRNPRLMARVYIASSRGLLDHVVGQNPELLSEAEFINEAYRLFEPYLTAK